MAVEPVHEDHHHVESVPARMWMPGVLQIMCLAAGIVYVVIGAVGLARGDLHRMTRDLASVGPFSMTPLLAFIILGIGIVSLAGAADRATGRSVCLFFGPALIALGIIALLQRVAALGWNRADGALFIVTGAVMLVAAMFTPPIVARTTTTAEI